VDSKVCHYMAVDLDPETGLPMGPARLFSDSSNEPGVVDGSVMDRNGTIWNARWGAGEVHSYAPDGSRTGRYAVPMKQVTCPAFIGAKADGLALTSAWEHMDEAARAADPAAGTTLNLGIAVEGVFEPHFKL
jgi:sugar lactone lactonase